MSDPVVEARLRLALTAGLGPVLTRRLVEACGGIVEASEASVATLSSVKGISNRKAEDIRRSMHEADVEGERRLIESQGVTLIGIDEAAYPPLLRHIDDPPPLLYVRGTLERADGLALAMVGARKCTQYGREQADRLAGLLSQAGLTIISGGARGIDSAAHAAAMRSGGRTVAVLGCGLGQCYPPENKELFGQIARGGGAVISELPMRTPPLADNFPARNRIISGLSLGVLVIEASARSGATITARLAAEEHHREVMALPGRVDSPASAGCHRMIREGWATLVTSPADILECLGEAGQTLKAALDESPAEETTADSSPKMHNLSGDIAHIYEKLTVSPMSLDDLCGLTNLPIATLQSHLMQLQLTGLVERLPANRVRRRN